MVQDLFRATSPSNDISREEVAARDRSLDSLRSSDQSRNRRARSCHLELHEGLQEDTRSDGGRKEDGRAGWQET